jgi:spore coat protein A, manganese oxidase
MKRQETLRAFSALAAGVATGLAIFLVVSTPASAAAPLDGSTLTKFVDPLPVVGVMQPSPGAPLGSTYYEVTMSQFSQKLHRDLPPTPVWGYNGSFPGPTFEARQGERVRVKWINNLPSTHLLHDAVDTTLHGVMDVPEVRSVVHLHGGHTPSASDGYPEAWYTNDPEAAPNGLGGPGGNFAIYDYPNEQLPTTLWYHDHAMGITRLNIYSGLAGVYLIRSPYEEALNLPSGEFEIPLVLQDRSFNVDGTLFYPATGQTLPDGSPDPETAPVWVPEFFGDTILVNGKVWPYLDVAPRKYRFRVLDASGSRFYNLRLSNGQSFYQIGTDGGLLPAPVALSELLLAPAERADLVIDFKGHEGEVITVTNDAATPFPDGGDANDPLINPNLGVVMQFRVGPEPVVDPSSLPGRLVPVPKIPEVTAVNTRRLTLNENESGADNPIESLLGILVGGISVEKHWADPVTETPTVGTTEIWSFYNLTGDWHPIHVHLVQFQILDRQQLLVNPVTGEPLPQVDRGAPREAPSANEAGWKDTVQAKAGMVTRVIMKFTEYTGKYVWHCHITEHEDHDMMRPYEVVAKSNRPPGGGGGNGGGGDDGGGDDGGGDDGGGDNGGGTGGSGDDGGGSGGGDGGSNGS